MAKTTPTLYLSLALAMSVPAAASAQESSLPAAAAPPGGTNEPALPAWDWNDPKNEHYDWMTIAGIAAGIAAVAVAADLYFGGGWTASLFGSGGGAGAGAAAAKGAANATKAAAY